MKRRGIPPEQKAALLGTAVLTVPDAGATDPITAFLDKHDLNNPKKRLLVAGGLVGAFMLVLRAKSFFT